MKTAAKVKLVKKSIKLVNSHIHNVVANRFSIGITLIKRDIARNYLVMIYLLPKKTLINIFISKTPYTSLWWELALQYLQCTLLYTKLIQLTYITHINISLYIII